MAKRKILVVDDDPTMVKLINVNLKLNNYSVVEATSGEQALAVLSNEPLDLVVLDIMMPGTDGYGVCNELKSDPATANIPVIFLTGKDRNDDMGRSFKVGGDMFIKKPFSCERLLEIVNIILMSTGKH